MKNAKKTWKQPLKGKNSPYFTIQVFNWFQDTCHTSCISFYDFLKTGILRHYHSIECADQAVASKSNAIQWPHGLDAKRNASWNRFLCTWVVCSLHGAEEPLSRPFASSFWNQGTAASTALDSGWSRNQATPGPFANEGCWVPSSNTGKRAGMPAKRRGMVNNHATNATLKTTQSFIP